MAVRSFKVDDEHNAPCRPQPFDGRGISPARTGVSSGIAGAEGEKIGIRIAMAGNIGGDDLGRDLAEGDAVAAETHHGEDVRQAGNAADERQAGAGGAEGSGPDMVRLRQGKAEQSLDLAVDGLRLLPKLLRRGIGVLALLVLAARDQPAVAGAA